MVGTISTTIMSAQERFAWRVGEECRHVGCTAEVRDDFDIMELEYVFWHDEKMLRVPSMASVSNGEFGDRIRAWLDELHKPLIEARRAAERVVPEAWMT